MMIYRDVIQGRSALNFSEWNPAAWGPDDTERLVALVSKDQMPLQYYLILHPEARLTANEEGQLINGFIETITGMNEENIGAAGD
jgi:hypothetical protein